MLIPLDVNNPSHLELTYRILLERYVPGANVNMPYRTPGETFSATPPPPSWDEHVAHLQSGRYEHMYLWDDKGFFFIKPDGDHGMFILREFCGQGIGTAAMTEMMARHPRVAFGHVNLANEASKRIMARLGFRPAYEVWVRDVE